MCKWYCLSEGPSTNLACQSCGCRYCAACWHGEAGKMSSPLKCARCGARPTVPMSPRRIVWRDRTPEIDPSSPVGRCFPGSPLSSPSRARAEDTDLASDPSTPSKARADAAARALIAIATQSLMQAMNSPTGSKLSTVSSPVASVSSPVAGSSPPRTRHAGVFGSPAAFCDDTKTSSRDSPLGRTRPAAFTGGDFHLDELSVSQKTRQGSRSPTPPASPFIGSESRLRTRSVTPTRSPEGSSPVKKGSIGVFGSPLARRVDRRASSRESSPGRPRFGSCTVKPTTSPIKDRDRLEAVFGKFTGGCAHMDRRMFVKLCKDCDLLDKRFTFTDADITFTAVLAKGKRRISVDEFFYCLELVAEKKKVTVELVHFSVAASSGPFFSATQAENVRFHDDKSTYTGTQSQKTNQSPRLRLHSASCAVVKAKDMRQKHETTSEGISSKLSKARQKVSALEQELAKSEAQVQKAWQEQDEAQCQMRSSTLRSSTPRSSPPRSPISLTPRSLTQKPAVQESFVVYAPRQIPQEDAEFKRIYDQSEQLKAQAEAILANIENGMMPRQQEVTLPIRAREDKVNAAAELSSPSPMAVVEQSTTAKTASEQATRGAFASDASPKPGTPRAKISALEAGETQAWIVRTPRQHGR